MDPVPVTHSFWWKFFHFPLTRLFFGVVMVVGIQLAVGALVRAIARKVTGDDRVSSFVLLPIILVAVHLSYLLYVRLFEGRPATELFLSKAAPGLALGIAVGTGIGLFVIGVLWLLGYMQVVGNGSWALMLSYFTAALYAAYFEEILARGILFRILEESLGTALSLALTALIFGLLHARNPNATMVSSLAIALSAGIVLGAAYAFSRLLWVPIGLHFAWNFLEGGIFGLPVSGKATQGLLRSELRGPELVTGGTFGPEASVLVVIVGLAVGAFFLYQAMRKGLLIDPFWIARRRLAPGG